MARGFAGSSDIYIDEFDFSGVITAVRIDITNPMGNITAFDDADDTFVEGKSTWTLELNGLYSLDSPNYDGEMFIDLTSSNRLITVSPMIAAATGGVCYFGLGDVTSQPRIASVSDSVLLHNTWTGNKPLTRGTFAHVATDLGTTANGTAYQLGSLSATQQLVIFQHVIAVSGTNPTLDTIIASDSEEAFGDDPQTRATFDRATAVTSEREVVTGAEADTWWRAQFTIGGTDTPLFSVIIGFGISNYNA